MANKKGTFSHELIGREAFELVRERGWTALSARSLAARMGSSVGPIYSSFGSMEGLQAYVLEGATRVFDACIARAGSGKSFLDMGIGMAVFARDEPRLFSALLEEGASVGGLESYKASLHARLDSDSAFGIASPARRGDIFERMWLFGLGLAMALVHGYAADRSDAGIARLMASQGGIVIYGVAAGFADEDPRSLREAWAALSGKEAKE
jgi:AcrR family transcriptional regulator